LQSALGLPSEDDDANDASKPSRSTIVHVKPTANKEAF